jgi:cation transporter-like permease
LALIGSLISWGSIEKLWTIPLVMIVTVLANVIGYLIVGSLIFLLVIFAFKKELDPDNFAIPLAACLADLICAGAIIIFSIIILPDVGVHEGTAEAVKQVITATINI